MTQEFYSNGKLLLSGEYAILDGALGLAIPTRYGQSLAINKNEKSIITWQSIAENNSIWFEASFDAYSLEIKDSSNTDTARTLQKIVQQAKNLNAKFLNEKRGYSITTDLDFNPNWGLGSSSTLINNIAQWAEVDPYELLRRTFSGSGYDIACARSHSPILYQIADQKPYFEEVHFSPSFQDKLYFVYLNHKQNSREGIAQYHNQNFDKLNLVNRISEITRRLLACKELSEFENLLTLHENLISENLKLPTVKSQKFPDFLGSIKSLGAWGGDFILVTSAADPTAYFEAKGFDVLIPFEEMVLKKP